MAKFRLAGGRSNDGREAVGRGGCHGPESEERAFGQEKFLSINRRVAASRRLNTLKTGGRSTFHGKWASHWSVRLKGVQRII